MSLLPAGPYTLTIASAGTDSPALSSILSAGSMKIVMGGGGRLGITTPAALTGTCTVQVVGVEGGTSWETLQVNGTDVSITAGKTNFIPFGGVKDIRIHSSGAEGADRDFILNFQISAE